MPDVIGAPAGDAAAAGDAPEAELTADDVRELMDSVTFEQQDVQDLLAEFFDWLADKFQSDHWRLTERQMRILGKPTFRLVNVLWQKLEEKLPDVLVAWCAGTPGASAFLLACGIVVGPKIKKQMSLSSARKKQPAADGQMPSPRKSPTPAPPGAGPVPAAAGWVTGGIQP